MVMWIVLGATSFTIIFTAAGAADLIMGALLGIEATPIVIVIIMQLSLILLGCFMDSAGIILLTTPILYRS